MAWSLIEHRDNFVYIIHVYYAEDRVVLTRMKQIMLNGMIGMNDGLEIHRKEIIFVEVFKDTTTDISQVSKTPRLGP
jgi:hypothetical protein